MNANDQLEEATDKDIPLAVQLKLIQRRTERGMKPAEIARLMGLKVKDVKTTIKVNGWTAKRDITPEPLRGRPAGQTEKTESRVSEIRRLTKEGYARKDIAAMLGITRENVDTLCRRFNVRPVSQKRKIQKGAKP